MYKGEKCLLAINDFSGQLVNWQRIAKRDGAAQGELSMAWEADVRLIRPGLKVKARIVSSDVLEYITFDLKEKTPVKSYWGQTVGSAQVEILRGLKRDRFDTEGVLETMTTGAAG